MVIRVVQYLELWEQYIAPVSVTWIDHKAAVPKGTEQQRQYLQHEYLLCLCPLRVRVRVCAMEGALDPYAIANIFT